MLRSMSKLSYTFRGFDDWVELFEAGRQVDSAGKAKDWTTGELDEVVANHAGGHTVPIVIGHPKTDAPSYGWGDELKREGRKLFGKFAQVESKFADMVKDGRFPNRSIKLVQTDKGWKLAHVGFLGAAAPAIEGLAPMSFAAEPTGTTYEFAMGRGWGLSTVAQCIRSIREMLIAKFGQADADTYLPDYQIQSIQDAATQLDDEPTLRFNQPQNPEPPVDQSKTFTQADIDAAVAAEKAKREAAEAKAAEFAKSQALDKARVEVKALVDAGRLLPAQAAGLAEFVASLESSGVEFEFSAPAADGQAPATLKKPPAQFMREFLAALPQQIEFGRRIAGGDKVDTTKPESIIDAAREFQKAEADKGHTVAWHEAVAHVTAAAT